VLRVVFTTFLPGDGDFLVGLPKILFFPFSELILETCNLATFIKYFVLLKGAKEKKRNANA
jgi:hypothetical protein